MLYKRTICRVPSGTTTNVLLAMEIIMLIIKASAEELKIHACSGRLVELALNVHMDGESTQEANVLLK